MSCPCFMFAFTLTSGTAAIAADHGGQRKQFPDGPAYDDYYDLVVDIGDIGVESFADRVQALLVVYLRETYGDGPADWCEEFWTGDRGRMCLAHARYSGSNNNMGVEVSWKLIKEICSYLVGLSTFKTALRIYKKFHLLSRQSDWGKVPVSCSCKICFANCVCAETIMFVALFNPKVRVPADQVTVTVSKRQVHKPIGGTAGRKKRRLIEERACNEKAITSKVKYLKDATEEEEPQSPQSPQWVVPEAKSASPSEDDDFEVHTSVASDGRPD